MNKSEIEQLINTVVKINSHNVNLPSLNHTIEKLEDKMGFDEVYDKVLDYICDNDAISELDILINNLDNKNIIPRTKTEKSLYEKWNKNIGKSRAIKKVFNDIIGIRIVTDDNIDKVINNFDEIIEKKDYKFIKVDFRIKPKKPDDGYRGVHLYADTNSKGFRVEIQVWDTIDAILNFYTHQNIYKVNGDISYSAELREWLTKVPKFEGYNFEKYLWSILRKPANYSESLAEAVVRNESKQYSLECTLLEHYRKLEKLNENHKYILQLRKWIESIPKSKEGIPVSFIEYIYIIVLEEVI